MRDNRTKKRRRRRGEIGPGAPRAPTVSSAFLLFQAKHRVMVSRDRLPAFPPQSHCLL